MNNTTINIEPIFQQELDKAEVLYNPKLDQDIFSLLKKGNFTISIIESYTSGFLCQRLNKFHGSNTLFKGGIVCHHPMELIKLCGLSPSIVREYGLASHQVALELSKCIQKKLNTHIGLACIGSQERNQTQTVYLGYKLLKTEKTHKIELHGTHLTRKKQTSQVTLTYLRNWLENNTT